MTFTRCPLCCRLANSEKQGVRTHAVSVSGKGARGEAAGSAAGGSAGQRCAVSLRRRFPDSLEREAF